MALINYIVPVEFDFGAVRTLPAECAALGMSRVLLVTDNGLRRAGLVDRILALTAADYAKLFEDCWD